MNNEAKKAFTLIELIVVIIILGILATVALPNMKKIITRTQLKEVGSMVELIKSGSKYYNLKYGLNIFDTSDQATAWEVIKLDMLASVPGLTYTFGTDAQGKYILASKGTTWYKYYFYGLAEDTSQRNDPDNVLPANLP